MLKINARHSFATKQREAPISSMLDFKNTVLSSGMPIDSSVQNKVRQVRSANYSKVKPTPLKKPMVKSLSTDCLKLFGVD